LLNRIASCIARCHRPTDHGYKWYGARGIRVFAPWREDRAAFLRYLLTLPGWDQPDLQLDRVENSRGYEPGNLRFASRRENMGNRRTVGALQRLVTDLEAENARLRSDLERSEALLHCLD
jgi:hypothetical protein